MYETRRRSNFISLSKNHMSPYDHNYSQDNKSHKTSRAERINNTFQGHNLSKDKNINTRQGREQTNIKNNKTITPLRNNKTALRTHRVNQTICEKINDNTFVFPQNKTLKIDRNTTSRDSLQFQQKFFRSKISEFRGGSKIFSTQKFNDRHPRETQFNQTLRNNKSPFRNNNYVVINNVFFSESESINNQGQIRQTIKTPQGTPKLSNKQISFRGRSVKEKPNPNSLENQLKQFIEQKSTFHELKRKPFLNSSYNRDSLSTNYQNVPSSQQNNSCEIVIKESQESLLKALDEEEKEEQKVELNRNLLILSQEFQKNIQSSITSYFDNPLSAQHFQKIKTDHNKLVESHWNSIPEPGLVDGFILNKTKKQGDFRFEFDFEDMPSCDSRKILSKVKQSQPLCTFKKKQIHNFFDK